MGSKTTIYKINCPECSNVVYEGEINVTSADIKADTLGKIECDRCGEVVDIKSIIMKNMR